MWQNSGLAGEMLESPSLSVGISSLPLRDLKRESVSRIGTPGAHRDADVELCCSDARAPLRLSGGGGARTPLMLVTGVRVFRP